MSDERAIIQAQTQEPPVSKEIAEMAYLAKQAFASGLFGKLKSPQEAFIRMVVAKEMGLSPTTGLRSVYLVNGTPAFTSSFLSARVKMSRRYNYLVKERSATKCVLEWTEAGQPIGKSEFTMDMAKRAGLTGKDVWKQYPESMLFARALTDGVRTYCPDVMMGHAAYTPEEIGGDTPQDDLPEDKPILEAKVLPEITPSTDEIWNLIKECGADVVTILREYKADKVENLTPDQKRKVKKILMATRK